MMIPVRRRLKNVVNTWLIVAGSIDLVLDLTAVSLSFVVKASRRL
jgi:hypothetical protein